MPTSGLRALHTALVEDSPQLIQGHTVDPLPVGEDMDRAPEACCPLGYAAWQAWGLRSVRQVDAEFAGICFRAFRDGIPTDCQWALNWFDETPRDVAFPALAGVVARVLAERAKEVVVA